MSPLRRIRFSDSLAETRILARMPATPVAKVLLQLADLIVRDGCVKDSLEFYGDLSNQATTSIARLGEGNGSCSLALYQVSSPTVRKLAAAMALSPEGMKVKRDHAARLVVLVAIPESSSAPNLVLPSRVIQLLGDSPRRECLLACAGPADVLARIVAYEMQSETAAQGA